MVVTIDNFGSLRACVINSNTIVMEIVTGMRSEKIPANNNTPNIPPTRSSACATDQTRIMSRENANDTENKRSIETAWFCFTL
jgi:hypothetical protein